jgi:hypothetical protein
MNYHPRAKHPRPAPNAHSVQGETDLRVFQSVEGGWKIFGEYKVPAYIAAASAESMPTQVMVTTTSAEQSPALIDALPPPRLIKDSQKLQRGSFYAIQEWEGYVSGIDKKYLYADLVDLVTGEKRPSTHAKIPLQEIPESELRWAVLGAIFRWSIGYRRSMAGQKDRVSRIRFRLLKSRPQSETQAIDRQTEKLANYFSKS